MLSLEQMARSDQAALLRQRKGDTMRAMRWNLVLAAVLTAGVLGCEQEPQVATPTVTQTAAAPVPTGEKAECLICVGHMIDVTDQTPTAEFEGSKYFFCSEHCQQEFSEDPAKALAVHAQKVAAKAGASTKPAAGH